MRKTILVVLGVLAAIVAILAVVITVQPDEFQVERRIVVDAPARDVFEQVDDFHHWKDWSPWAKLDPNMTTEYSGEAKGEGASYAWKGNSEVGEGRMTIVESDPGKLVRIELEFIAPFAATNICRFEFEPAPAGGEEDGGEEDGGEAGGDVDSDRTKVTWSMEGRNNFMMKGMHLVMDMDGMVGKDFEKGLAQLKETVEAGRDSMP